MGRFELADGGTLFLDEIANVPPNLQAKLLRVLEAGELERVGSSKTQRVDVRMISATNADLTRRGGGRTVPPGSVVPAEHHRDPRCRRCANGREDIPLLAAHFLGQACRSAIGSDRGASITRPCSMLLDTSLAGQCARAESRDRAGRADGAGRHRLRPADLGLRSGREAAPRLEDMSLEEVEAVLIKKRWRATVGT